MLWLRSRITDNLANEVQNIISWRTFSISIHHLKSKIDKSKSTHAGGGHSILVLCIEMMIDSSSRVVAQLMKVVTVNKL